MDVINELADVLIERKGADPTSSYVASLYEKGRAGILEKIEEESWELVEAATTGEAHAVIHETADLWFHTLVLLSHLNVILLRYSPNWKDAWAYRDMKKRQTGREVGAGVRTRTRPACHSIRRLGKSGKFREMNCGPVCGIINTGNCPAGDEL